MTTKVNTLALLLTLIALASSREYYGNLTCDKCMYLTECDDDQCYFWNSPYKNHTEVGCFDGASDTCSTFYLPYMVF